MDYPQTLEYLFNKLPMYSRIGAAAYRNDLTNTVQLSAALRRAGRPLPIFHPIELVDASIRGLTTDQLLQEARR